MASFIKTPDHLTVVFDDGHVDTIYPSNPNYDQIIDAVNDQQWSTVRMLADASAQVREALKEHQIADRVHIHAGVVYYDDKPMHMYLTDRMLEMLDEGYDIAPMALFLQNLMENPSRRAVQELYGFLEKSNLPITEDGCFLAYKRINSNWTDAYTGKVDNSIGATPEMPRNEVDEDKDNTCSVGYHFCSRSYLPSYGAPEGGRVITVKINPRDVVAIPRDYNNAKGRCCRYEVINEIMIKGTDRTAMPTAKLEGMYRHSGTPVQDNDGERLLAQINLETGEEVARFTTPSEAQRMTGIDSSGISKVARGKRNSAGGYGWEYFNAQSMPTNTQLLEDECDDDLDDLDDPHYGW